MKTINNNIQESYCSFEVSKLLKEKGFNVLCPQGYDTNDLEYQRFGLPKGIQFGICSNTKESSVVAPTHALAIEWIRVNFGIWIQAATHEVGKWCYHTQKTTAGTISPKICENGQFGLEDFDSPQEATEAAIKYTLKNLIP